MITFNILHHFLATLTWKSMDRKQYLYSSSRSKWPKQAIFEEPPGEPGGGVRPMVGEGAPLTTWGEGARVRLGRPGERDTEGGENI